MARNETEQVRHLQRTLYRTAKQSQAVKFYSLYDKVWRNDVLREAWRQGGADDGGSPARVTDFTALQQHLSQLAGSGVAQTRLPGETGGCTAPLR